MRPPALELSGISMRFGDKLVLGDIDLAVEQGRFLVLLGPSGGGKTTLLNILGGFLEPSAGRVLIEGADVTRLPPARRPTTTVFQDYALFPHMSVGGNVGFGLAMRRAPAAERRSRIARTLEMVGLAGMERRRTHELSGGQRQRVALARALVVEPPVLLLDEPLGALDLKLRRQMQEELKAIQKRVGTTFVHVTHDQDEAMAIADSIVVLNQGVIEDQGPPERVYLRPATRFTATFMGESNLLEGRVSESEPAGTRVETALGTFRVEGVAEPGRAVTLSLRPEHLHGAPGEGRVAVGEGSVIEAGFFGTHHQCLVQVPGVEQPLRARLPQKHLTRSGESLRLHLDPADLVLLLR